MKRRLLIIFTAVFALFLLNSNAIAGYLDSGWEKITIYDGFTASNGNEWRDTENEDQEVEPGATIGENWDLEGFYFSDGTDSGVGENQMAVVGGFDFVYGEDGIALGDIFIDTDMDNTYYEYIMDLNFTDSDNPTYQVIDNTDNSATYTNPNKQNISATINMPVTYTGGGNPITGSIAMTYLNNQKLIEDYQGVGGSLVGDWHNVLVVDVSSLGAGKNIEGVITMECGNDVSKFQANTAAAVPEPATIFLLGSGLLGLFGYRKKMKSKK